MRGMFGLVSLLVVLVIGLMIFRNIEAPTIKTGEKAQDQARQISGHGEDGGSAMNSFATTGKMRGSTLDALNVTSVKPGGAMAGYGLQVGDQILEIDGMKVGDISVNDAETAKAMVVQKGFEANAPIVVMRGDQRITLPSSASAPQPGAAPATPNNVQNQLKNLGIQTR